MGSGGKNLRGDLAWSVLTHLPVVGCVHAHRHAAHAEQDRQQVKDGFATRTEAFLGIRVPVVNNGTSEERQKKV
jgi:hypothetical protein